MNLSFFESNPEFKEYYGKLQDIISYIDNCNANIESIKSKMFNLYPCMLERARTEDEKAFAAPPPDAVFAPPHAVGLELKFA